MWTIVSEGRGILNFRLNNGLHKIWENTLWVSIEHGFESDEFKLGLLHEKCVVAPWEPSQRLFGDGGKPRKKPVYIDSRLQELPGAC
jgi:hypothetical protein